jgi:hypothetical protein
MSATFESGQPVYVSATFDCESVTWPGKAYVIIDPAKPPVVVPLSSLSAAPTPQQIADLRESIDQIAPTGPMICAVCEKRGRSFQAKRTCPSCGADAQALSGKLLDEAADAIAALVAERDRLQGENDKWKAAYVEDVAKVQSWEHDLRALQAKLERVRHIHGSYAIYGECHHDHDGIDGQNVVMVEDIGYTCAKLYDTCSACCRTHYGDDEDGQSMYCAESHDHGPDKPRCSTIAILDEPNDGAGAPQAVAEPYSLTRAPTNPRGSEASATAALLIASQPECCLHRGDCKRPSGCCEHGDDCHAGGDFASVQYINDGVRVI